jgi:hypothetical protein
MTLTIDLPAETEERLLHEATARGLGMEEYVRLLLQERFPPADFGSNSPADRAAAVHTALGMFRHMPTSSDAYSREKQAEMDSEDRL